MRRGSLALLGQGAAASKPMKARIVYTDPATTGQAGEALDVGVPGAEHRQGVGVAGLEDQ